MGSTEPTFGDEYRTPVRPTIAIQIPHLLIPYGGIHQNAISMSILNPFDNPLILMTLLLKVGYLVKR
jgi:hypothetical protein